MRLACRSRVIPLVEDGSSKRASTARGDHVQGPVPWDGVRVDGEREFTRIPSEAAKC